MWQRSGLFKVPSPGAYLEFLVLHVALLQISPAPLQESLASQFHLHLTRVSRWRLASVRGPCRRILAFEGGCERPL